VVVLEGPGQGDDIGGDIVLDGGLRSAQRVDLGVEGLEGVEVVGEVGEVGMDGLVEGEVEGEGSGVVGGVGRVKGGGGVHGEPGLGCQGAFADLNQTHFRESTKLSQFMFRTGKRLDHRITATGCAISLFGTDQDRCEIK
jgi:hypothetical protein